MNTTRTPSAPVPSPLRLLTLAMLLTGIILCSFGWNAYQRKAFLLTAAAIAALPMLLLSWLLVSRTLKRWHFRLAAANRQLDERAAESIGLTVDPDARVKERTAQLEESVRSLRLTVTELQTSRDAAEQANRAKSEFLANMSHEIRTPMNGILGMTELVLDSNPTREQREFLEMVKSSAESLMEIINDILDFSKIEAGRLDLEFVPFRIREVVTLAAKALAVKAQEKNLELIVDILDNVPDTVVGDPTRLRQVVTNLVGNAIKFTPSGEVVVHVEAEPAANHSTTLSFSVVDTGIGISAEKQPLIFEAFIQAEGSTTRDYGGTGLGLAISSKLVRMMGGELGVNSTTGAGSTFHFRISLGVEAPVVEPDTDRSADLTDVSVLVVDDNATNRRIYETMLTRWRMRPRIARDGPSAIEAMQRAAKAGDPFRLVILDSNMPGMDGFTVVERIRANPILAGVTVMMLTSAGREDDARRCREQGVVTYLTKPVAQNSLLDAIKTTIGTQHVAPSRFPAPATTVNSSAGDSLDILVAEDNVVNQVLIRRLLEKLGHRVQVVDTGVKVLEALELEKFDLVFMDVQMPELDGLEATKAIRQKEKSSGAHIPVIALTAHAMKADRERCLAAGMDAFLSKPIEMKPLMMGIQAVVGASLLPVSV